MTGADRVRAVPPLALTLFLFVVLMAVLAGVAADPDFDIGVESAAFVVAIASWAVLQSLVGTIIVWRRPHNRIGRIMQASGPLLIGVFLNYNIAAWRYVTHGVDDLLGGLAAWWASSTILLTVFISLPLLGLLFPDGRLPSPRFTWPLRAVVAGLLGPTLLYAIDAGPVDTDLPSNPLGVLPISEAQREALDLISTVALLGGLALAVGAVITRWRRGDPLERAQLKWLLGAFAISPILFALSWAGPDEGPIGYLDALSAVSAILVPIAIGIAVLRYRLYEIDRIVSRTVGWVVVTAALAVVFAGTIIGLQALLAPFKANNTLAVAGSTLLAAALFQPLRARVQRAVDRRFNRARVDAQRAIDGFGAHLRDDVDFTALHGRLLAAADATVQPNGAGLWIRGAGP